MARDFVDPATLDITTIGPELTRALEERRFLNAYELAMIVKMMCFEAGSDVDKNIMDEMDDLI